MWKYRVGSRGLPFKAVLVPAGTVIDMSVPEAQMDHLSREMFLHNKAVPSPEAQALDQATYEAQCKEYGAWRIAVLPPTIEGKK
jgi:hypothetical protein